MMIDTINLKLIGFFVCVIVSTHIHTYGQSGTVLKMKGGYIKGQWEDKAYVFKGVPYAAPPVGPLRFKPPQPLPAWRDTLLCQTFGNMAAQYDGNSHTVKGSEDCLTLNIYSPTLHPKKKLPVLVWIHGGAMTAGAGMGQNGHSFADNDSIITITINYRLGVFGFMYLKDIDPGFEASGNNGLLDCIMALQWIKQNIVFFGGDASNVTVMGESAGAKLASTLLVAPKAKGYFHQLILESGAVQCIRDVHTATVIRNRLQQELHMADAKDLLSLSTEALITAQAKVCNGAAGTNYFGPVDDSITINGDPYSYLRKHKNKKINVLIGTNKEESKMFMSMDKRLYQPDIRVLEEWFGTNYPFVLAANNAAAPVLGNIPAATTTLTQYMYQMHSYRLANTLAKGGNKVWMYRFDYGRDSSGATHAQELPFVWLTTKSLKGENELQLAAAIHNAWVNFIRHKKPGEINTVVWPLYKTDAKSIMVLDISSHPEILTNIFNDTAYPSAGFILN